MIQRNLDYLRNHIAENMMLQQDNIEFSCEGARWPDIEVDEMTLGKWAVTNECIGWHNYIGLIERGRPTSLIIHRLPNRYTGSRAPCPGPLMLKDWTPIAQKHLSGRGLVLHHDSAHAYDWAMPRVSHSKVPFLVTVFFWGWGGGGVG